jgi:hypothetical protein
LNDVVAVACSDRFWETETNLKDTIKELRTKGFLFA